MIARAIERGVDPEMIAKALDIKVSRIIYKKNLLEPILKSAQLLMKKCCHN